MTVYNETSKAVILTPEDFLRSQLLIIEQAGRNCYRSEKGEITLETASAFIRKLVARQHFSVLEHSVLTVLLPTVSRGLTHEGVRHRHVSPSQSSTRYVDEHNADFVEAPSGHPAYTEAFEGALAKYAELRASGERPEDARQVLPIGTVSPIVFSANFHAWRDVFAARCAPPAHWEIRRTYVDLLQRLQPLLPGVFDDFVSVGEHRGVPAYRQRLSKGAYLVQQRLHGDAEG